MAKKQKGQGGAKASGQPERKLVATHRRARFEYEILETFEAGIVLSGPEVKSLRDGGASLAEAFAMVRRGELWLLKMHVRPYEPATRANLEPTRDRKLLLHKAQIRKIEGRLSEPGVTSVPLSLYFNEAGRAKVEIGLVRGKKLYDKRETVKRRDADREARRSMRRGASRR